MIYRETMKSEYLCEVTENIEDLNAKQNNKTFLMQPKKKTVDEVEQES